MTTATLRGLGRRGTALLAATLLCVTLGSTGTPATTSAAAACDDDLLVWRPCGDVNSWWARKRGAAKPANPGVARGGQQASSNPTTIPVVDTDFKFSVPATYDQLRLRGAHQATRGAGVRVAVLDGGFNLHHPDLAGGLDGTSYDAIDDDDDAHDTGNGIDDDFDGTVDSAAGHGTFVCGMIRFVAPEATILPIRVRDDEGWGTNKELERGLLMAWMLGADVINISGESAFGRTRHITNLIEYFRRTGIVVVNSAGNQGLEYVSEIGDAGDTLIVGAIDRDYNVAEFSNTPRDGAPNFVMAPGVDMYGPLGIEGQDDSRGYYSGTSFSTALVSGVAALVRARHPYISTEEIMDRIVMQADPLFDEGGVLRPYGTVNASRAVNR